MPEDLIKLIDAKIALLDAIDAKDEELIAKCQLEFDKLNNEAQKKIKGMEKTTITNNEVNDLISDIDERVDKLSD